ncbi:MAG TPA: helix-turn-helix transcriptional regulator [Ramlibacter sp.]|jgi:transcriptional regulator with XRE-family HTH domain
MEELQNILATNVRLARAALGISQEELAELSGLDRTYISGVERGVRNPTVKVVGRLASALKIPPHQLLK